MLRETIMVKTRATTNAAKIIFHLDERLVYVPSIFAFTHYLSQQKN